MMKKFLRNSIITGALCTVLAVPSFVQAANVPPIDHWSETYIDQLSINYDIDSVFMDKDLDTAITVEDFRNLVKLVIDKGYNSAPDAMTREAVVYELTNIWAEKTGQVLKDIPAIEMFIYSDTAEIENKYNHSIIVAYTNNIAKGRGMGVFDPKAEVTYDELAALINNTNKAIKNELKEQIGEYADNLDSAEFYDLDGDKQLEILVGEDGYDRDKELVIFKSNGKKYEEFTRLDYADFSVGDLEGDGILEIASIVGVNKQIPSVKLQVHGFSNGSFTKAYETEFQHGDYPDSVIIGVAKENQQGIFVELGLGAHSAITEIVVKENGEYKNVLAHNNEYDFSQTFKPYPLFSKDINNDGIIEVGVQTAPPETAHFSMAGMPWVNNWYQWDGEDGLTKIMEEYSNYSDGYQFVIPENWHGKYTIDKVTDESFKVKSVHFIYLATNKERAELLTLHHMPKEDWPQQEQKFLDNKKSFIVLDVSNSNVLVAELARNDNKLDGDSLKEYETMLLDEESIKSRFIKK